MLASLPKPAEMSITDQKKIGTQQQERNAPEAACCARKVKGGTTPNCHPASHSSLHILIFRHIKYKVHVNRLGTVCVIII